MSKKKRTVPAVPAAPSAPAAVSTSTSSSSIAAPPATAPDSPRRRMIANLTLVGFSIYVALIWLLALNQEFHWGIFKP